MLTCWNSRNGYRSSDSIITLPLSSSESCGNNSNEERIDQSGSDISESRALVVVVPNEENRSEQVMSICVFSILLAYVKISRFGSVELHLQVINSHLYKHSLRISFLHPQLGIPGHD